MKHVTFQTIKIGVASSGLLHPTSALTPRHIRISFQHKNGTPYALPPIRCYRLTRSQQYANHRHRRSAQSSGPGRDIQSNRTSSLHDRPRVEVARARLGGTFYRGRPWLPLVGLGNKGLFKPAKDYPTTRNKAHQKQPSSSTMPLSKAKHHVVIAQ